MTFCRTRAYMVLPSGRVMVNHMSPLRLWRNRRSGGNRRKEVTAVSMLWARRWPARWRLPLRTVQV